MNKLPINARGAHADFSRAGMIRRKPHPRPARMVLGIRRRTALNVMLLMVIFLPRMSQAQYTFGPENVISTEANGAHSVFAIDVEGDGDVDVLSASPDDDKIAWYEANSAPTISDVADQTIDEDGGTGPLAFTVGDLETAAADLTVKASSDNTALVPNNATNLTFGGSDADRTLTITPAADANGSAIITVTVSDGDLEASDTFTLTVNAVNDAPVVRTPGPQSVEAYGGLDFSSANGNAVTIADVDAGAAGVEVTLTFDGTITLGQTTDLYTFSEGRGIFNETMTFTGTVAAVNTALEGMTYVVQGARTETLRIRVDDQGHTGQGGALTDAESIRIDVIRSRFGSDPPPPPPDLTGPGVVPFDGAQDVDLNVTLIWPDVPDADRYHLVLTDSTGTSATGIVVDVDTLTALSFAPGNLQPMHVYAWRIASISEGTQGLWSATITFETRATSVSTERYGADLPARFALQPSYPNPFNPATIVPFDVPEPADVRLEVYNILGQHIAVLASGPTAPGRYRMTWQSGDQPSGIYFVRMQAGSFTAVRRLLLIK